MLAEEDEYDSFLTNLNSFKGIEQVRTDDTRKEKHKIVILGSIERFPRKKQSFTFQHSFRP